MVVGGGGGDGVVVVRRMAFVGLVCLCLSMVPYQS